MRAPEVAPGSRIFVEVADTGSWVGAEVLRQDNTLLYCRDAAGNMHDVDLGFTELLYQNETGACSDGTYDDMTAMLHIHEPGMLDNLRRRVRHASLRYVQCRSASQALRDGNGEPYTYMGTVLVAVNPLRPVPNPHMQDYSESEYGSRRPHPYAIAELAYARLCDPSPSVRPQSIIVSGESGAGKTESSRMLTRYLSWRGNCSDDSAVNLAESVKAVSPILEAFGNAATLRNANSSRFGQFLKLVFSRASNGARLTLLRGELETYLLEKTRVTHQALGESNFHALHQVCTLFAYGPRGRAGPR